ncbi:DUF167 domain-containing protein [Acidobacteriota bacterium]
MSGDEEQGWIKTGANGRDVEISVHLSPRGSRDAVDGIRNGQLRIKITSPPVDDAANKHLIKLLARLTGISKSRINIVSGHHARIKRIAFADCTTEHIVKVLLPRMKND